MGRVLYGVAGDSGGHVSRSLAIAQQLRGHEVIFVGGGRVKTLAQHGYSVVPVPLIESRLSNGGVSLAGTAHAAVTTLAQFPRTVSRLSDVIREARPDLVISDYEFFTPVAARRMGYACVSVDRHHALTMCRYRSPSGHWLSRNAAQLTVRTLFSVANHYLVCSFVPMQPIDARLVEVFPPVLRQQVTMFESTDDEHVLVYLPGTSLSWVRELLSNCQRRFLIYGFDLEREEGNLTFRRHSESGFLADLASSAYVISNGGHNVISEALHYGKPLLCLPTGLLYEQFVNGYLVEESGYGAYARRNRAAAALDAFEANVPSYRKNAATYSPWGRRTIAERLEAMIANSAASVAAPAWTASVPAQSPGMP